MRRIFALFAVVSLLVVTCMCDQTFRGVAKSEKKRYQDALGSGQFRCFDGEKTIPASHFNDDYCDCHDGSDEPGTSACLNGRFWCRNKFHVSLFIPSSRVNDGICDCCDGSDEYASRTKCSDVCYELGSEKRKASQEAVETYQKGLQVRAQYVERSQKELALKKVQLEQIESELSLVNEQVTALKADVVELEKLIAPEPEASSTTDENASNSGSTAAEVTVDVGNSPLDSQVHVVDENSASDDKLESRSIEDNLIANEDNDLDDSDDTFNEQHQNIEKNIEGLDESDDSPTLSDGYDDEYYERYSNERLDEMGRDYDEDVKENRDDQQEAVLTGKDVITAWYSTILNFLYDLPEYITRLVRIVVPPPPPVLTPLEKKRNELQEVETKKNELESSRNKIQGILNKDFGADKGFFELHEKCFDLVAAQYTYSVCPYKQASQKGDSTANLGRTFTLEENASKMVFRNGDGCWQGPSRSMTVSLTCGSSEAVLKVEEPEKCVYTSVMATPLACTSSALEALLGDLRREQNPDSDDQ